MKTKLLNMWRWCVQRLPEALLLLFLLSLVPLAALGVREALVVARKFVAGPIAFAKSSAADPWPAVSVVVCVLGTAALLVAVWRNWYLIWAVGRKMILEAVHRKVVIVLLVFFVVLVPTLPLVLKTEGSLKSQVQIVLLYSLVLGLALLSLVAIFVATASICSEIERRHVHIVDTKPLPRWQFLLGKWLGAVVMCTAVLYVMAGASYLLVMGLAGEPDYDRMTPAEMADARSERWQVINEVLVARKSVTAPLPDVSEEVEAEVERLRAAGTLSPFVHSQRQSTREQLLSQKMSVAPGETHRWDFTGLEPRKEGLIQVRFKAFWRGGRGIYGGWMAVRPKLLTPEGSSAEPEERLEPLGPPIYPPMGGWTGDVFHEFSLPAEYIAPDGSLTLLFQNADPRLQIQHSVVFNVKELVEVLQKEEGFLPNYYRSLLIILFHVSLLAALGLMAGALFSFPVAALVVSCLFIGGLIGPWFSQFIQPDIYTPLTSVTEQLDKLWRGFATFILALMPNFGSFSPFGDLVNGRMVTWGHVSTAGAVLFFVKGGAALLIGMYFYARRELARVIV